MEIRNAEIKFNSTGPLAGALILDEKQVIFHGCNISDGIIESYHHPRFRQCFLKNVITDRSSPGEEDGPIFCTCWLENMRVPLESIFNECAGDMPKHSK